MLHLGTTNLVVICSHVGSPREISARAKAILLLLHFSRHGRTSCVAFSLSYLHNIRRLETRPINPFLNLCRSTVVYFLSLADIFITVYYFLQMRYSKLISN